MERTITIDLSFGQILIQIFKVGTDYQLIVSGGDKPHIGCTVLAIPRMSLTGNGKMSATSSVINVTGHKDETICRHIAEQLAAKENAVVVCSGGIHVDHITKEQIDEILGTLLLS